MNMGSRRQQGVALVIVLLMISIIVALTIQLSRETRSQAYGAANVADRLQLQYVARSGLNVAEALLLADKNPFDALTEVWANTDPLSIQSAAFFPNGSFRLVITDEGGKIPLNHLLAGTGFNAQIRDLLLRLLTGPTFKLEQRRAEGIIDAIKDWVDADEEVTGDGAEGAYYAGLARPYGAKNAALDCIEELLMVKGMSRELFYGTGQTPGLRNYVTVFGDGRININTAPKPVLRALTAEITDEDVELLDAYRRSAGNDLADAAWYQKIRRATPLAIPASLISVKSDVFSITALGIQERMTEQITAVVKRSPDRRRVSLLSWKVD